MPNNDQSASAADVRSYLLGHRLTAAFPVLHDDLVARLQAGGVRSVGGKLILPDGNTPSAWLEEIAEVRTLLAREARRARAGGGDAPALPSDTPLSPLAAAQVRQERAAKVTAKLARANGELEGAE